MSTETATIDRADSRSAPQARPAPVRLNPAEPSRVLIVEDDRAIAQLTAAWMRSAGYEVGLAFTGGAGLDAARAAPPAVVLLDLRLPDLDGLDVHRAIRQDAALAHTPVIFLSANVQENARREAAASGAFAFVSKPYEARGIIALVGRAIAGRTDDPRP